MSPTHPMIRALPLLLLAVALPQAAAAQETAPPPGEIYRREVFSYPRAARPDPFRSLLQDVQVGVRYQDLRLRGVIYNPEGGRSVAVLWDEANQRRIRGSVGDRIGSVTIVAITPRRVDVVIEEFGVARRESLQLTAQPQTGTES
jgi:hypothetical protein